MINKQTYRWSVPAEARTFKEKVKQGMDALLGPQNVLFNIIAILLMQVRILEGITPFILPFVAMVPLANIPTILVLAVITGFLTQNSNILLTLIAISLIWTIKNKTNDKMGIITLVLPLLITFNYMPTLITSDFITFDILLLGLQIVMGLTSAYIFKQGMVNLSFNRTKKGKLESNICTAIMAGIALSGIAGLSFGSITLMGVISKLSIMLLALTGGVKLASTCGIIIGLLSNFNHPHITYFISYYAFSGLTAGLMSQWKKTGIAIGYICGAIVMFVYSIEFFQLHSLALESSIAILVFALMPKKAIDSIEKIFSGEGEEKAYQKHVKEAAIRKIYQFSSIFKELSQGFNDVAVSKFSSEQQSLNEIIDIVQQKACQDCKKHKTCWYNEFYSTYKDMFSLITLAEEFALESKNIPDQLFKKCINLSKVMDVTQSAYDLYKINYQWQNSLIESKGLVANQLEGIAKVMENLAMDINLDMGPRRNVEEELWELIKCQSIECDDIKVSGLERDKPEVQIIKSSCGGNGQCEKIIANIVEKRLKTKVCVLKGACEAQDISESKGIGKCKFALISKEKYKMSIGLAQKAHNQICGDTFNQFAINNGKHVVILSDGMGKGEKAKDESERIVGLMKKMLQVGFDTSKAIKTINSVLSLRGNNESFATLDLAIIDLYKGKADIYKNGAATSFIKSGSGVKKINGSNLPVGMIDNVDASISNHTLQKGDFLVMVSDGVLDTNPVATDKESWLTLLLENITANISPNRLAELILHKSRQRGIEGNLDDLSVVVIKMEGNHQPAVLGRWAIQKGM